MDIHDRTFNFAVRIVQLAQTLDSSPGTPRTLSNQLLRSGTSIGANLEESKGAQSKPDFIAKTSISLKEARETLYWLRLLTATHIVPEPQLKDLTDEANQIVAILTTILKNSRKSSSEN